MLPLKPLLKNAYDPRQLYSALFHIQTIKDCYDLAWFLAYAYPSPNKAAVALCELFINAIEHGNLDIGYELKGELIAKNAWHDEIAYRLEQAEHQSKFAKVNFKQDMRCIVVTIEDMGRGFQWWNYQHETLDSINSPHHGRGIAKAKYLCFDRLYYSQHGRCVEGITHKL